LAPFLDYWSKHGEPEDYKAGTWGPTSADKMLRRRGHSWRRP